MEGKVLLYNSNDVKIGETYMRRARQLVKQQRAVWIDDGQEAIRFAPGAENLETVEDASDAADVLGAVPVTDKKLMELARRRVILKIIFKSLCLGYLAVNAFLVFIWLLSGGGYFWPIWTMAGWGLGIVIIGIIFRAVMSPVPSFNDKVIDEYNKLR